MKTVQFGNTGQEVSEMCLGTMMFGNRCDESESSLILHTALDRGVNIIDTAESYEKGLTEEILGRIMKGKREKIFIITKGHIGEKGLEQRIDESLKRLQTDHIDCYLIHWPKIGMDVEKVMSSLNQIVQKGKARFIGCSNYPAWLLSYSNALAGEKGWEKFRCLQVPYNLIERGVEVEVLPMTLAENLAVITYRPLVIGLLTGKYIPGQSLPEDSRGKDDERIQDWLSRYGEGVKKLIDFAEKRNLSPAQVAIAWVRFSPAVTCPIVGVSSVSQLKSSVKAFDISLSEEEYQELTGMFDTEVKEESGGKYKALRRELFFLNKDNEK